jgi:hypothetical protein
MRNTIMKQAHLVITYIQAGVPIFTLYLYLVTKPTSETV